jgi:hypothetical protein
VRLLSARVPRFTSPISNFANCIDRALAQRLDVDAIDLSELEALVVLESDQSFVAWCATGSVINEFRTTSGERSWVMVATVRPVPRGEEPAARGPGRGVGGR